MTICLQVSSLKALCALSLSLQLFIWLPLQLDKGKKKFVIIHNKYIVDIFWLTLVLIILQLCLKSSKRSFPFSFDNDWTNLFQLVYSLPTTLIWFSIMKWPNTLTCTQINDYSQVREHRLCPMPLPSSCHLQSDFLTYTGCIPLCSVIRVGVGEVCSTGRLGKQAPSLNPCHLSILSLTWV